MNLNKIIKAATEIFKRKVMEHCETINLKTKELTPALAEEFTTGLKESLCATGLVALKNFVESYDEKARHLEKEGTKYHWKMASEKTFLTPWNYVDDNIFYSDYKKLLDFYHMTEHLSKASETIFGKKSPDGKRWYKRWRKKMLEVDQTSQNLLQSLHYYANTVNLSVSRQKDLKAEITFFRRNQHLMTYAAFLHQKLPIGSGPVEAACKTIVKHRLCRSGMRWSIRGGQHILYLRCYAKSNRWDLFWNSYKFLKLAS